MYLRSISLTLAALALSSGVSGQTVTVNSAGGADHTTINDALAAVKANAATPDVINITGGGPYTESFVIDSSVSINGDSFTPTIITPGTSGGPDGSLDNRGISITTTAGDVDVTLQNLTIIPQNGSSVTRAIFSNNNTGSVSADNMTITLQNVLVTGNDGSDNPVTTDGLTQNIDAAHTYYTDDLVFFTGLVTTANVNNCIISHGLGQGGATTPDGIVFFPDSGANTLNIGEGTVVSYTGRIGIQVASDESSLNVNGTAMNPVYILETGLAGNSPINGVTISGNNFNGGLALFHDNNSNTSTAYDLNYLTISGGPHAGIDGAFVDAADSFPSITADHLIITNMGGDGMSFGDDINEAMSFTNSTIAGNGNFPVALGVGDGTSDATIDFTNVIIAGNGSTDATNTVFATAGTDLTVNFNDCGLVTNGTFALDAPFTNEGTTTFNENTVINDDPIFANISNPTTDNFIDISGAAYQGAAGGGGDIVGAGEFLPPSSSDNATNLYQ